MTATNDSERLTRIEHMLKTLRVTSANLRVLAARAKENARHLVAASKALKGRIGQHRKKISRMHILTANPVPAAL